MLAKQQAVGGDCHITMVLFRDDCSFTDDTVMTIATADTLMNDGKADGFIDAYKKWGQLFYQFLAKGL